MILAKKLVLLKEDLKKWNMEVYGKLEDRKCKAMAKLEELDHNRRIVSPHDQTQWEAERMTIKKEL